MSRIIVTGASGQLGNDLKVLFAEEEAHEAHFFNSSSLNITNSSNLEQTLQRIKPHFLINCAAYTAVDHAESNEQIAFAVNAKAVEKMAAICATIACQFIHISSDYVYHNNQNRPILETDPTTPKGVYAMSKLKGDVLAQQTNPTSIILRTSWVYSSFGNNFLKTMLRLGKERDQLGIVYDQIGVPTYARDIGQTILAIMRKVEEEGKKFGGIYNYAPQGVTCWYDYAKAIFELENIDCSVNSIPSKAYPTPAERPHYSVLNCSKIKNAFGIEIPYWKDSVKKCLQVLKKERVGM